MPIELATNIAPTARSTRVGSETLFFHLLDGLDVNYKVETIISGTDPTPTPTEIGTRYLLFPSRTVFTPQAALDIGFCIVEYAGAIGGVPQWELVLNCNNSKTNFGLVFVEDEKRFYQFIDNTIGWKPLLASGSVDGGTFG
jgi:hypothetical protein